MFPMRRPFGIRQSLWLGIVIASFFLSPAVAKASYPSSIEGRVVGVHDGDTITVLQGKKQYKIRLDGIDAPELSQAYGQVSKRFASDFAFGKTARVEIHGVDRYGRYLGEVFVDGHSLNRAILAAGLAWHYKQYSKDPSLAALEDRARQGKIGLWKDPSPVPPWEFRRQKK